MKSVAATTALLAFTLPAHAETALTVAHGFSPTHVIAAQGVDPWMACVKDAAGGDVAFSYFPSGQVAKTTEMLDALENGIANLTTVPIGYVSDRMPLNGVSMLPGMGSSAKEVIATYSAAVKDGILADEFAANEIVPVWVMLLPAYQIVSTKGPLRTPEDFAGKVLRSAGGTMNLTISALGASPAEIPSSDMYVALERGTADATLSALASIKPYNIQELMNAVSTNGAFGSFSVAFSMDKASYEALPDGLRQTFLDCGAQTEAAIAAHLDGEVATLQKEFSDAGVDVYAFTDEELSVINGKLASVVDDWVGRLSGRGLPAAQAVEAYRAILAGN
ncbi:MAG: TRAP transporter substrate-binding protein [Sagittula sp.]|uniref:TRAP transporter substrate-binding protein n=1 Tax=Sagittula sp. TaxID=2038081 RepID=UPI00405933C4